MRNWVAAGVGLAALVGLTACDVDDETLFPPLPYPAPQGKAQPQSGSHWGFEKLPRLSRRSPAP